MCQLSGWCAGPGRAADERASQRSASEPPAAARDRAERRGPAPPHDWKQLPTRNSPVQIAGVIDSDNFLRRRADGQRPHPVPAHRRRPDAAPRASSRPTHLCAGMTAGVPDWWGAVGSAALCAANGESPLLAQLFTADAELFETSRRASATPEATQQQRTCTARRRLTLALRRG